MGLFTRKNKKVQNENNNAYEGLKELALEINGDESGYSQLGDDDPYKALVEFCVSGTPVSIFAALDGTASIYFGTGGGYLGGGQKSEDIAKLAVYLVSGVREAIPTMSLVNHFESPIQGKVTYYGVTRNGVYSVIGDEQLARDEKCEYFKLYHLSQFIISHYRNISENK